MTKPTKWHKRPVKTQISLGIRLVWSESSLFAWRKLGSLATHWAHREDSDQTGRMLRLIWIFAELQSLCWFCHEAIHFCFYRRHPDGPTQQEVAHSPTFLDYLNFAALIIKNPYALLKVPLNEIGGKLGDLVDILGSSSKSFIDSMSDLANTVGGGFQVRIRSNWTTPVWNCQKYKIKDNGQACFLKPNVIDVNVIRVRRRNDCRREQEVWTLIHVYQSSWALGQLSRVTVDETNTEYTVSGYIGNIYLYYCLAHAITALIIPIGRLPRPRDRSQRSQRRSHWRRKHHSRFRWYSYRRYWKYRWKGHKRDNQRCKHSQRCSNRRRQHSGAFLSE